ncbi:MAG TPA: glycine betaine ABC transporter substrate-binding protein [Solirubrobacteraceae bacterium]|nr:glycine betaine ABC transporter substrate-binding protein [Solirubrobacteraceae bacterium]
MRAIATILLAALAVGLGACGGDDDATTPTPQATATQPATPPIRIGTKDFTEEYILGELYSQALEAAGFDVELKRDIGSSEIVHQALDNGALDMYPDYVGILLSEVADVTRRPATAAAAYELAKELEEKRGFTLLKPTPFSDSNALAVTPDFARRHGVRSISDLRRLRPKPRIGAPKEFSARFEGLVGLRERYGLRRPRFTALEFDQRYPSLDAGRVDVTLVFTTERQLSGDRYVVLDDPRNLFADQHVAPVISREVLQAQGPKLETTIDAVSAVLTTEAMRRMNGAVDIDGREAREVATEFLRSEGLL